MTAYHLFCALEEYCDSLHIVFTRLFLWGGEERCHRKSITASERKLQYLMAALSHPPSLSSLSLSNEEVSQCKSFKRTHVAPNDNTTKNIDFYLRRPIL